MTRATETVTLRAVINSIEDRCQEEWWEVMDVEIEGLAEALREEAYNVAESLEEEYIAEHGDDLWEVTWPEHVVRRVYNGDAWYRPVG